MNPLFSIITATYNSDKTLETTIQSILSQNYKDFEFIIIDGKSNDNTLDIIKKYESIFKESGLKYQWISESDSGIYNAWNKGLKLVTGKWVAFLGSDDIYLDGALEKYAGVVELNPQVDFIHSKVKLMSKGKAKFIVSDKWNWNQFKRYMKIAHVGSFHNTAYFEKYGSYNEDYKIAGDYEMLLRAKNNLSTVFFDHFTAEMNDGGVSNNNVLRVFREVKKAKISTARIPKIVAFKDFYLSLIKYYTSKFVKRFKKS